MQTQPANNKDQKAPVVDDTDEKPTEQDPDNHNPPMEAPGDEDGRRGRADFHGSAVNREDGAVVEAAEGEIRSTPQGP